MAEDRRKYNRGHKGSGRKPKSDEIKLIERLDKHIDQDEVFEVLSKLALDGNLKALQIYMNYRYGRPKEHVEVKQIEVLPIFHLDD